MRVKLYREHKYVSFALSELERLIAKTDFTDDAAVAEIQNEWLRVKEILERHAHHEEHNFHALLERKDLQFIMRPTTIMNIRKKP